MQRAKKYLSMFSLLGWWHRSLSLIPAVLHQWDRNSLWRAQNVTLQTWEIKSVGDTCSIKSGSFLSAIKNTSRSLMTVLFNYVAGILLSKQVDIYSRDHICYESTILQWIFQNFVKVTFSEMFLREYNVKSMFNLQ